MVLKSEILIDRLKSEIEYIRKTYTREPFEYYQGKIDGLRLTIDFIESLTPKKG